MVTANRGPEMYKNLSPLVASQYYTNDKNSKIPHVIVVSADGNKLIGSVSGMAARQASGYKDLKAAADAYLEDGTLMDQPKVLKWYHTSEGVSYEWPFYGLKGDRIIIGQGKRLKVRGFDQVQPGGVKFAKRYAKAIEENKFAEELSSLREDFKYPETETWVSSAGKSIEAQFVSLNGEQLDLEINKSGYAKKKYSFALDKLSEESQAKAKEWNTTLAEQKAQEEALKEQLK